MFEAFIVIWLWLLSGLAALPSYKAWSEREDNYLISRILIVLLGPVSAFASIMSEE